MIRVEEDGPNIVIKIFYDEGKVFTLARVDKRCAEDPNFTLLNYEQITHIPAAPDINWNLNANPIGGDLNV